MRITTIKEAMERVGETIACIQGKIIACYNHEQKSGQHGDYSLQHLEIQDSTGKMRCSLFDQRDLKAFKGKNIILTCGKNKNDKLAGVAVEERDNKGKKSIELKVSGLAHIDAGVESVNGHSPDPTYPLPMEMPEDATDEEKAALEALAKAREAKAKRLQEEAAAKARQNSEVAMSGVAGRDVQIGNLYIKALKMAVWACKKEEVPFFTESVATVFLALREDGVTDLMPKTMIRDAESPAAPETTSNKARAALPTPGVQPDPEPDVDQELPATWGDVNYNGQLLRDMDPAMLEYMFNTFKPKPDPKTNNYNVNDLYVVNALKQWKKEQL